MTVLCRRKARDSEGNIIEGQFIDCAHLEAPKNAPWYRYSCLLAPKQVPRQFVVEDPWLTESPHHACHKMNPDGQCEKFERKPDEPAAAEIHR